MLRAKYIQSKNRAAVLRMIFWICVAWLTAMAVLSLIFMAVVNFETGKARQEQYLKNWFTYYPFVFLGVRIAGSCFVRKE